MKYNIYIDYQILNIDIIIRNYELQMKFKILNIKLIKIYYHEIYK